MGAYTRFEVYIPRYFTVEEKDSGGVTRQVTYWVDDKQIQPFIDATRQAFEGVTQFNPSEPPPFKGWWEPKRKEDTLTARLRKVLGLGKSDVSIDYLTYVFCLVSRDAHADGIQFYTEWKQRLERQFNQEVILVLHYAVETIGNLS